MLGLRFTFHTDLQRPWLTDGTADWLWSAAERAGVPIMVFVPGSAPAMHRIAAEHPGLRLVIDHLALGGSKKDAAAFAQLPEVLALAKHPNVAVKASALPCYSSEPYPFRGLHSYIRQVYDAFGPAPDVLGHGLDAPALHLSPGHHFVYRGAALADRGGPGMDHGARRVRVARLAASRNRLDAPYGEPRQRDSEIGSRHSGSGYQGRHGKHAIRINPGRGRAPPGRRLLESHPEIGRIRHPVPPGCGRSPSSPFAFTVAAMRVGRAAAATARACARNGGGLAWTILREGRAGH